MSNNLPTIQATVHDGKPTVNSHQVAKVFNKRHDNVIRDIRNLAVSQEFNALNFAATYYLDSKGEARPAYNMTRNGFLILAMGYTGAKAMALKEAYISEFNRMEEELAKRTSLALPDFTDPAAAVIAWAEQYRANALTQQQAPRLSHGNAQGIGAAR